MSTIRTRDERRWAEGPSSCAPSCQLPARAEASGPQCAAVAVSGLRLAVVAALALLILVLTLCLAGFSGIASSHSLYTESPFAAEVAFADELAGPDTAADAADVEGVAADDAAPGAEGDEAASDEELVTEEIEDDEVPLAAAIGADRSIKQVIVIGIIVMACAFALFMRRVNRNMDTMRHRFR